MALAVGVLAVGTWACGKDDPAQGPIVGGDASPDIVVIGDTGASPADTGTSRSDAGDSGVTLTPQRVEEIRTCMDGKWGSAPTRLAIEVADDFDECTTEAENGGDTGGDNFDRVVDGWAEPDPADHSRMRKVVRDR